MVKYQLQIQCQLKVDEPNACPECRGYKDDCIERNDYEVALVIRKASEVDLDLRVGKGGLVQKL